MIIDPTTAAAQKQDPIEQQSGDDFDARLKNSLTKRLCREPLPHELINADNDADLVNEVLWQMVLELTKRVAALEAQK